MAAPEALPTPTSRQQVHLPPRRSSDFVIHYRSTDFHVHSLGLHHHSTYFQHYLQALQPLGEAEVKEVEGLERAGDEEAEEDGEGEGASQSPCKKQKLDVQYQVTISRERSSKCSHSPVLHCIDLPDQCGIIAATEVQFLEFLRHLYFASTYRFPPFSPARPMKGYFTDETPICLTFPTSDISQDDIDAYAYDKRKHMWLFHVQWLSLFQYFACESALKRCELVILADCKEDIQQAFVRLPDIVRFGLTGAKVECLRMIREDWWRNVDKDLQKRLEGLTPAVRATVVEACCNSSKAAPP